MLTADFHVHTLMSGHAFCSFNECATAAAAKGLTVLGLTDHGPALERAPYEGYFSMAPRVPRHLPPVKILFGCESNILDLDGTLDLPKRTLDRLDLVLAQVHHRTPYTGQTEKDHTAALVNAIKKNRVHIIPHLFRPDFPVTLEEVLPVAIDRRVLIEINKSLILDAIARPASATARLILARTADMVEFLQARDEGYLINSDAHHTLEIGVSAADLDLMSRHLPLESRYIYNDRLDLLSDRIPRLRPPLDP
jgi:putative hydrolase